MSTVVERNGDYGYIVVDADDGEVFDSTWLCVRLPGGKLIDVWVDEEFTDAFIEFLESK